jgi:GAF domain-containing protein
MARPSRTGGNASVVKARSAKGRNPARTKRSAAPAATRSKRSPDSAFGKELKEAREQQAATADILKVIATSPTDTAPVFEAIVRSAKRLLGGYSSGVYRIVDGILHLEAFTPLNPKADEALRNSFPVPISEFPQLSLIEKGQSYQYADTENAPAIQTRIARARGFRSILLTPLMHDGTNVGLVVVTRTETGPFADHYVELMKTFADQAVIAIENVRLFNETQQALERQTATADILKVIASSPDDVQPVFEAIAASARHLIGGHSSAVTRIVGDELHLAASAANGEMGKEALARVFPMPLASPRPLPQVARTGEVVILADTESRPDHVLREMARVRGYRSMLGVPMLRDGVPIGTISVTRAEPGGFDEKTVGLLKTFADQAVIAIGNARLFNETQEALERQTATAEILRVISQSPADVRPVFDSIVLAAVRLLHCDRSFFLRCDDTTYSPMSIATFEKGLVDVDSTRRLPIDPARSFPSRAIVEKSTLYLPDISVMELPGHERRVYEKYGNKSGLFLPLIRGEECIGVLVFAGKRADMFGEREIALAESFREQALIAIENVRLFEEVQARTQDLEEALRYQTGSASVLNVIASSPTDVEPVLNAIVEGACTLCEANDAAVLLKDGEHLRFRAHHGPIDINLEKFPITRGWTAGRAFLDGKPVHLRDTQSEEAKEFPDSRMLAIPPYTNFDVRTVLSVPLLRESERVGVILLRRIEMRPFSDKQIALLQTFADQAVIAINNARLFDEVQAKTRDLSESLHQQTATADVLKVISRSAFDLQTVLDTLVASAVRLCEADIGHIVRPDETGYFHVEAHFGFTPALLEELRRTPFKAGRDSVTGRALLERKTVQILDGQNDPEYNRTKALQLGGYRSLIGTPLLREGVPIGAFGLSRYSVRPFTEKQMSLLSTFADQAVIAIENTRLINETKESLAQQTATSEVLNVISSSVADTAPVFEKILDSCENLFATEQLGIFVVQPDGQTHVGAWRGAAAAAAIQTLPRPLEETATGLVIRNRAVLHVSNSATAQDLPLTVRGLSDGIGDFSMAWAPMLTEEGGIGSIAVMRQPPSPFSEKELALLKTFADQAVIAIQNTRLFNETREALARQTATSDVLKVIASSPSNLQPVFDAITERSKALIGAHSTVVVRYVGGIIELAAFTPVNPEADAVLKAVFPRPPTAGDPQTQKVLRGEIAQISDAESELQGNVMQDAARARGWRSRLLVPLKDETGVIGWISITRKEAGGFAEKDVELLQTFADQAVIAIKNVELFEEVQTRTRDLQESLNQQTATSEVLQVISSSPGELGLVFDKMLENATRVCGAEFGSMVLLEGDAVRTAATFNAPRAFVEARTGVFMKIHPKSAMAAAIRTRQVVQVEDYLSSPAYLERNPISVQFAELSGARTILVVPMLREDDVIGLIIVYRQEVQLFGDKQIDLLTNFARQAVIAIENARLLRELRERTDDLQESLQQQTAAAEVLKVISSSSGDLQPVFKIMLDNALRICEASYGNMMLVSGDGFELAELHNSPPALADLFKNGPLVPPPETALGRVLATRKVAHIPDILVETSSVQQTPLRVVTIESMQARTLLAVPMLRESELIGVIVMYRQEMRPFSEKQIELVANFADQAVIAIGNARLLNELRERTEALTRSLDDLRAAQDRLVQTEKLASLGQLTAGIAHEIKNPLNFVNNFSALSVELTDELNDFLKQAALAERHRKEVDELTSLLKDNLSKILQHGKRADSIVKNMLLHSREGSGEHRPADINTLVEESLNLAYHGARAEGRDFNITLERDFDQAGVADIYPQEITRALLNLISNGFYAATKHAAASNNHFEPKLKAATRNLGDKVEIRIRDNGMGIPPDIREKIFNPFFTTKPAGEGTGLGLSMTHDIVVKQHGGTIDVVTEPGSFTEFIITLPRVMPAQAGRQGN